ncbi:MAG: site-2 protease family protein [Hydrogenophaga sp.]|nr:site-2 protease family protein [Hydrogenophaga sp.]
MDLAQTVQSIATFALPVLFSITLHEAAHGYAARHFGDDTAWKLGRVSLNPARHIDPMGTILMPLMLYFLTSGAFLFGYAKPVPVQFGRLKNPKRDMVWVALAGPGANLIQAIGWMLLIYLMLATGFQERFFLEMGQAGVFVNLVMFAFNLFPLPPLDGGRILVGLLPWKQAAAVSRVEPYGFFIVMALVVTGIVGKLWMYPLMDLTSAAIKVLLAPVRFLLF